MTKREQEAAKLAEIYVAVGEVENSKQVHLSEAERASLSMDLFRLNESVEQIRRRGEAVKRNLTYGKISLDVWLSSENLIVYGELEGIITQRIERRKAEYLQGRPGASDEELAKEGLIELQMYWHNDRRAMVDKHRERLDKKCRKLRAQFYHLPDQAKMDLWTKAVQRGIVKDGDPLAMQVLPFLIPQMMSEFEEAILNNSTK